MQASRSSHCPFAAAASPVASWTAAWVASAAEGSWVDERGLLSFFLAPSTGSQDGRRPAVSPPKWRWSPSAPQDPPGPATGRQSLRSSPPAGFGGRHAGGLLFQEPIEGLPWPPSPWPPAPRFSFADGIQSWRLPDWIQYLTIGQVSWSLLALAPLLYAGLQLRIGRGLIWSTNQITRINESFVFSLADGNFKIQPPSHDAKAAHHLKPINYYICIDLSPAPMQHACRRPVHCIT